MKTNLYSQNQLFLSIFALQKQSQKLLKFLLAVFLMLCSMGVSGQTSTFQLASTYMFATASGSTKASTSGTAVTWTATTTAGVIQNSWNTSYLGQQFGTGTVPWTGTFTAPAISGATITKIEIRANTGGSATLDASVGGTAFSPATISVTKNGSATDANLATYTFTGSKAGATTINVSSTSAAFYLNRIILTYTTVSAPTVTTTTASVITTTTASSGGNVTADGGATVTARGVYFGTTATPTSGTSDGTGTGAFTSSLSSLSVNTKYYYRAYATNSVGTSYGSELTFYTLAKTPTAPSVNNATVSTLDVVIGASDGNPSATVYAINETSTGKFVQTDGSLGATAVWQTATAWATKTVTGLTASTTYTFQTKARNGDTTPVETAYSVTTSGTTLTPATLGFWNLQYPGSTSISEGGTSEYIYAQAYKLNATGSYGPLTGLQVWIGYSSTNNNPNSAGWTWVSAPYSGIAGNNDEFKTTLGVGLIPGTYYYASRFQLNGGTFTYGGYKNNSPSTTNGGVWDGTTNVNGVLTVNSNVVQSGQVYPPSGGPITVGSPFMTYIQFYKPSFTEAGGQGTPIPTVEIGYNSSNNNAVSGTGWTWATASFDTQVGNNDQYKLDIGTARAAGTYYYAARIKMQGSTEYKYFGTSSFAYWNSDNGTFTVIAPPAITSTLTKSSVYGTADTYTITATGSATITYNATGLPTGLSVNTTTGVISGTATADVGSYNVSISATNGGGTDTKTLVWTITKKDLTISGLTGVNKIYDGTISATLSGTPALNTIVSGDNVSVSGTPAATFATKTVGTAKAITVTGYTLSGTKAGNYTVSQPTGLTANITTKALTVSGAAAQNKVYDGTTTATITGATLVGVISGDVVTVSGGGTFADANAGTGKPVTAALSLSGADATNYTITQPTGLSADITKKDPVFTTSPISVSVGGTYALPGSISSTSPGTLSYSMPDNAAATLTGGNTINGIAVGTNTLTVNQAATANYNAGTTTVSVSVVAFNTGDYMSFSDGTWKSGGSGTATWKMFNGSTWATVTAGSEPSAATTKNVYIWNTITLVGTNTASNIIIENGGTLDTNLITPTFTNLLVKSGGTFLQDGYTKINAGGILEVLDGGTFNFFCKNTTARSTTIWNGMEKFHPNSIFKITNADTTTFNLFENNTDIDTFTDPSTGYSAIFGYVIVDNATGSGLQILPAGFTKNLAHHDVTFVSNASNKVLCPGDCTFGIGGNLVFGSAYNQTLTLLATSGTYTANITVNGDFINNSAKTIRLVNNAAGTTNLNVEGNINLASTSILDVNFASGGAGTVNIKGDLTVASTAALIATNGTTAKFNFTGTGDGTTAAKTQTIDVANQATASNIAFNVNTGAYAKLVNNNLDLGTASTLTVNGTFDADQKLLKGTTGTQTLTVKPTGTFKTANANGFSGSTTTSVGPTIETIALNTGSTVEYSGANQAVTKQVSIVQSAATANYSNLRISGTGVKTISGTSASPTTVINKTYVDASELLVASTLDTALPNEFHADNGVEVNATATFRLANNANLIQASTSATINTGSAIAEREAKLKFVSVATQADYNYWSSPVANQKLLYDGGSASFSPGTPNNRIFQYNEKTDYFVPTTDANFVAGKAYAIRAESGANGTGFTQDGTAKTFSFTGKPNNGDISTPSLNYTDAAHGFNMIGNPYPSNIDFNAFYTANTGKIDQKAYFWTNSVYQANQGGSGYSGNNYATYNGTGGVKATGGTLMPTQFIKTGQGFLVQVKSAGALVFNNNMRVSGVSPFFNNKIDTETNRFWLTLTSPSGIVNSLLVGYVPNATNGLDANYDAEILSDTSDEFYSILGTEKLIIQGKENAFVTSDVVPLGTKYFVSGNYTITLDKKEGLFDTQNIYLKDKVLNTVTNLSEKPYEFTTSAGVNQNRFEIVYKPETILATTDATKTALQVYRDMEAFVVKSNAAKITKVEVYDGSGRLVIMQNANSTEVRLNAANFASGVYVLKIHQSETVVTKKIIK